MNEALHPHHHFTQPPLPHPPHAFPAPPAPATLESQHDFPPLDFTSFDEPLTAQADLTNPFDTNPSPYDSANPPRFHEIHAGRPINGFPQQHNQVPATFPPHRLPSSHPSAEATKNGAQFGVLTPQQQVPSQRSAPARTLGQLQHEIDLRAKPITNGGTTDGHFSNMKMIPNPPDLEEWRLKLFEVEDTVTMTEEEFQTYFPHVDNIYSHRSTQRYKRKPFVSHYWDCRLKGRPPGTAKSEDPNKKKRKRTARERDLCDVKIKITEHFPGSKEPEPNGSTAERVSLAKAPSSPGGPDIPPSRVLTSNDGSQKRAEKKAEGKRWYTIQRVNGNGANGKDMAPAGGHRHTITDSDKIKKSSVHRYYIKEDKDRRKSQKTYHKKVTGAALNTVKKHSKEHDLKLFGSCFCPFVQRVWISLELKGLSYQYIEIDPYKKPEQLLEINPRGLVPALKHGDWGCYESSVLMEYLEDLKTGNPLLPLNNAQARAHCRLWSDHINRKVIPKFYGLLQALEPEKQAENAKDLNSELSKVIEVADATGPFFLGPHISFVDVQLAPWVLRLRRVLKPYRAWQDPEPGTRWAKWVDAIEANEAVRATTSTDDLYLDSYERYAENRPDTSQVAQAVNAGAGLP